MRNRVSRIRLPRIAFTALALTAPAMALFTFGGMTPHSALAAEVSAPPGTLITVAGTGKKGNFQEGGLAAQSKLSDPRSSALDSHGNLFIADQSKNRILKVDPEGLMTTVAGGGTMTPHSGVEISALDARFTSVWGVAVDAAGTLYLADIGLNMALKVTPDGKLTVFAGGGKKSGLAANGGSALDARLDGITRLALDSNGNVYFDEFNISLVRKVDPSGILTTVAGGGKPPKGTNGDGGLATDATVNKPTHLAVDGKGNLYFGEYDGHRIRRVDSSGIITTVAGTGTAGFSGDGGLATEARLTSPHGMGFDTAGNLYIADFGNKRIRKVDANGVITTVAGGGKPIGGIVVNGSLATDAVLIAPREALVDIAGNLYINEVTDNDDAGYRVRKVFGIAAPGLFLGKPFPVGSPPGPGRMISGDLNLDGRVEVADATLSLQVAIGDVTANVGQRAVGDMNGDGTLDMGDTVLVLKQAVGL